MVKRGKVFVPGKSVDTKLKQVIDKQSIIWSEERSAARGDKERTLYASDYGQCMRKIWFQFFPNEFHQEQLDPRVLRIFHNGEVVHERLAQYLTNEQVLSFIPEVDVPRDELEVHGRCDGVCLVDDRFTVVEFKSINSFVVKEPKEEHVGQLTWYMAMWREFREELRRKFNFSSRMLTKEGREHMERLILFQNLSPVEKMLFFSQGDIVGELIYESKRTQETFHFPLLWSDDRYERVRTWFAQLKKYISEHHMPNVRYEKQKYPCSWSSGRCPFYDICWKTAK